MKFMCLLLAILLASIHLASSLELSDELKTVRRSDNPAQEIYNLVNGGRGGLSSSGDLLNGLLDNFVEENVAKLGNNIESLVDQVNSILGANLLVVSDDSLTFNIDGLEKAVLGAAETSLKRLYPNNKFVQKSLMRLVKKQINLGASDLRTLLANELVPLNALRNNNLPSRSKRDLAYPLNIVVALVRQLVTEVVTPIQTSVNNVLTNVTNEVLSFYSAEEPANAIAALVLNVTNDVVVNVVDVITVFQANLNTVFSNILNSTSISLSRRRRDADIDFENSYYSKNIDFAEDFEIPHRRVARATNLITTVLNLIKSVLSIVTSRLNALLKTAISNYLATQYENIGKFVTTPLRALANWLINLILPCSSNCTSI